MSIAFGKTVPILRIFDEDKAREFYAGYLGCTVDFEHRFEIGSPLYMQVSRGELVLHLSEHYGDGSPGTHVRVEVRGLEALQEELAAKAYQHIRPSIVAAPWNERAMALMDPFANRLVFFERSQL